MFRQRNRYSAYTCFGDHAGLNLQTQGDDIRYSEQASRAGSQFTSKRAVPYAARTLSHCLQISTPSLGEVRAGLECLLVGSRYLVRRTIRAGALGRSWPRLLPFASAALGGAAELQ